MTIADMLKDLLTGNLIKGDNWSHGTDKLMERPPDAGTEQAGKVIKPSQYEISKQINNDPKNIYNDQGEIVGYDGIGKSSIMDFIKKLNGPAGSFKGEQGTLSGFLSRLINPAPLQGDQGVMKGAGTVGGRGPNSDHVPGTGTDAVLDRTPMRSQKQRTMAPSPMASPPLEPGNIDLSQRPVVNNADGSKSTVLSKSFNFDGKEVLLPTISQSGMPMSDREAIDEYKRTGQHLGVYANPESATAYGKIIHQQQESQMNYSQPTALDPQQIEELRKSLLTQAGQMDPNNPNGLSGRMNGPYSKVDQAGQMDEASDIANGVRGGYNSVSGKTPEAAPANFQDALKGVLFGGQ